MKSPPAQFADDVCHQMVEEFIAGVEPTETPALTAGDVSLPEAQLA
jgi:hypothetical protein